MRRCGTLLTSVVVAAFRDSIAQEQPLECGHLHNQYGSLSTTDRRDLRPLLSAHAGTSQTEQ
jgi:hypothetical protein